MENGCVLLIVPLWQAIQLRQESVLQDLRNAQQIPNGLGAAALGLYVVTSLYCVGVVRHLYPIHQIYNNTLQCHYPRTTIIQETNKLNPNSMHFFGVAVNGCLAVFAHTITTPARDPPGVDLSHSPTVHYDPSRVYGLGLHQNKGYLGWGLGVCNFQIVAKRISSAIPTQELCLAT